MHGILRISGTLSSDLGAVKTLDPVRMGCNSFEFISSIGTRFCGIGMDGDGSPRAGSDWSRGPSAA